jgi:hypothetical protein
MKAKDTNLIEELITKLGICNCSILGKLALEGVLFGLGSRVEAHYGYSLWKHLECTR